jgi:hypothetical protein
VQASLSFCRAGVERLSTNSWNNSSLIQILQVSVYQLVRMPAIHHPQQLTDYHGRRDCAYERGTNRTASELD